MVDDLFKPSGYMYESFVESGINRVFVEINIRPRGGYLIYKDKEWRHEFLFASRYELFANKVNINDSIKKTANVKEFYIIKPDTILVVYLLMR